MTGADHPAYDAPRPLKNTLAFLVISVVRLVRPEGLLGRAVKERV